MERDLLGGEATLLRAWKKMTEETDRAWKDFFEKNPDEKEEEVRRRLEERLKSKQNSKNQDKGV